MRSLGGWRGKKTACACRRRRQPRPLPPQPRPDAIHMAQQGGRAAGRLGGWARRRLSTSHAAMRCDLMNNSACGGRRPECMCVRVCMRVVCPRSVCARACWFCSRLRGTRARARARGGEGNPCASSVVHVVESARKLHTSAKVCACVYETRKPPLPPTGECSCPARVF